MKRFSSRRFTKLPASILVILTVAAFAGGTLTAFQLQPDDAILARMTKGKLEADLGNFETASEAFTFVAHNRAAPFALRWEALVRLGLARYGAGDVRGSMGAFRSVKETYARDRGAIRFLTHNVVTAIPGKNWVDLKAEFEDLLLSAEVVRVVDIERSSSGPKIVFLERDETKLKAVWKPARFSTGESGLAEIGAYEFDKILGLDMVPPTVERTLDRERGALQLWVNGCQTYKKLQGQTASMTESSRELSRMKTFDYLIGNSNRNLVNILIDPNGEAVLVDHPGSFSGELALTSPPPRFDRRLIEKLRDLTPDELVSHLKPILGPEDIKNILARRDLLLAHVERLIAEKGEAAVMF